MDDLKEGHNYALYIATAGDYEWVDLWPVRQVKYELRKDPEFRFSVAPGAITYPGDLLFRPSSLWRAQMLVYNRGLAAMDWLDEHHPQLLARHGMVYSGHYPDPFPAFYLEERGKLGTHKPAAEVTFRAPPEPGELPLAVETLFRPDRIVSVELNPRGDLLAIHVRESDDEWAIELVDLRAGTLTVMATSVRRFVRMQWSGDDKLLVAAQPRRQAPITSLIRIEETADGGRSFSQKRLPVGMVVHFLPREPNHILYASQLRRNSSGTGGGMMVHRMDISSDAAIDAFRSTMNTRLNAGLRDDSRWLFDGEGRLRAAVVQRDDEAFLVHGQEHDFQDVMKLSGDRDLDPVGLSYDASRIYGITDRDREQRELVAFDVASRQITETLFSREGSDVVGVLWDDRQEPIGVSYYEGGRLVNEYFTEADNTLEQRLRQAFPGRTVSMTARSRDRQQVMLWVDGGDQPLQLFHVDVAQGRASLVADDLPWLEDTVFAPTEVVSFTSADGLAMEAFLTLPEAAGKRPLIVFPHGGPVGVADTLHFNREVQFLASLGYAVLQVNFRGSAGYGRAFREAGMRNHGTLIEDDIDAAMQHVLARFPLDETRMCAMGTSYGGYSALISSIRWPGRFKCAISMAGVSDRILFYTASDGGRSEQGRELLERFIGNPKTDEAEMLAVSPLYQFRELNVPVMLVHGREDRRVDFEHSHRLLRLLDMAGRTPVGSCSTRRDTGSATSTMSMRSGAAWPGSCANTWIDGRSGARAGS
ncbi:alpha/beta hydrolase family protein [Alkalisalibacterium limincola]|uniref:S9 family peptidase n=1 Tax=Alkalisalibacterium limincola TaxID=2699169 RepID=A0A5C8KTH9_9GAMM|nr:prolyl oligopeptidase family serine peptidase [Alkalisalibacterium limincola]TXK64336.1 S9 family peptidase [Alkalisalibacterium limincola]